MGLTTRPAAKCWPRCAAGQRGPGTADHLYASQAVHRIPRTAVGPWSRSYSAVRLSGVVFCRGRREISNHSRQPQTATNPPARRPDPQHRQHAQFETEREWGVAAAIAKKPADGKSPLDSTGSRTTARRTIARRGSRKHSVQRENQIDRLGSRGTTAAVIAVSAPANPLSAQVSRRRRAQKKDPEKGRA